MEQQANPLLRGKPVVVAAYVKDYGCILAASREAKMLGVKTGMRVKEGRMRAVDAIRDRFGDFTIHSAMDASYGTKST